MHQKSEGIVLRAVKCANGTTILDLYTSAMGRMQCSIGKRGRTHSSGYGMATMPLSILDIECEVHHSAPIQRLKEWKLAYTPTELPFHPFKGSIALFVAELLLRTVYEQEANAALFAFIKQSVIALDQCQRGVANFHLVFLMHLAHFLGIYPNLTSYEEGKLFHLEEAEFITTTVSEGNSLYLAEGDAKALVQLARLSYRTMYLFAMNREQRNRSLALMMDSYRIHLPGMGELRSIEVLQQLSV